MQIARPTPFSISIVKDVRKLEEITMKSGWKLVLLENIFLQILNELGPDPGGEVWHGIWYTVSYVRVRFCVRKNLTDPSGLKPSIIYYLNKIF